MHCTVFLVMFAVYLVTLECSANGADNNAHQGTVGAQPAKSPITITTDEQHLTPTKDPPPDSEPIELPVNPTFSETALETAHQTGLQSPLQQKLKRQKQSQQSEKSSSSTSKDEIQQQEATGVGLQNKHDESLPGTPEDVSHNEEILIKGKHTDLHTDQQEQQTPTHTHAVPPLSSSQSPGTDINPTQQRALSTTNTDNTLGEKTGSETTNSEKTPREHTDAQVLPLTSTDDKTVLPESNKTPNTTTDKNPIPTQKQKTVSLATAHNAKTQTATTTKSKETHLVQTSVTSTAEPENKEYTSSGKLSKKLATALPPLDKTDSSIGSSSLSALSTLVTFIVMAAAPAFLHPLQVEYDSIDK